MEKKWIYKPLPSKSEWEEQSLLFNVNLPLAAVLWQRDIRSTEEGRAYFRPSHNQLHNPFLLKNMEQAVTRLKKAIDAEEKILIYGDYDVDGTTAVALVFRYLKSFYPHCFFYVPDRYSEGYGVSVAGILWAEENNCSLIIALDVGIKAYDKVNLATTKGIDFIICDHHLPGENIPQAVAVLDPKQADCPYPYKELSGCGLGFKLIQAFAQKYRKEEEVFQYLDLVATSISSDIVPITGENRTLVYFGLQKINSNPLPGLKALIDICAMTDVQLTVTDIVFYLGPRINAAGRLEHARRAVELLLATTREEAEELAKELDLKNTERRGYDLSITDEAETMIERDPKWQYAHSIVLCKDTWNKGVLGIVASRVAEKFYRPTIILTGSNQKFTGSARSIPHFDLYEALYECRDLLENFGGHTHAAGLTLKAENLDAFQKRFEASVTSQWDERIHTPIVEIDTPVHLDMITPKFYNVLRQMEPFGPENQKPIFSASHLKIIDMPTLHKEKHLSFLVSQQGNQNAFKTFGFDMAEFYEPLKRGARFQMAFTIEENVFNKLTSLQFRLKDIKLEA